MKSKETSKIEFIILMALLTSVIPLSIDGMLPAFPNIKNEFYLSDNNQLQLIVSILFLGFGLGQFLFGPLSDVFGRKIPIYYGIGIFVIGSILSGISNSWLIFLLGRFLQGFGGAAPRIISLALIRDKYKGEAMAQITSLVMTVFILVPAIAPALGQGVLLFYSWREIFILLGVVGFFTLVWFAKRQKETLPIELRRSLNFKFIIFGTKEVFKNTTTISCMIISGLIFGIFIAYLGVVQEIFAIMYNEKERFPLFFSILALSIGAASFFNSRVVMAMGMEKLICYALKVIIILSMASLLIIKISIWTIPPLWFFMIYLSLTFFSVGFLFGNLNALAMKPLGHVAGIGSAILGCVQSVISVLFGMFLGNYFHENVIPILISFGLVGIVCLIVFWINKSLVQKKVSIAI